MPHYQLMNKDPESLLVFLEHAVMATGLLGNSKIKNQPEFLELKKVKMPGGEVNGEAADVYYVKNSDETSKRKALKAFICDYTKNDVESCILDPKKAQLCFTITMNGCTFGVGHQAQDGTLMVTHANTGGKTEEQREQTFTKHGTRQVSMMEPALYRHISNNLNASTFGIWNGKKWNFYFQLYRSGGGMFKSFGTFPILAQKFER